MGPLPEEARGDAIYRVCTRRYISCQGNKFSKVLAKYRSLPLLGRITELL
jgi:hypothetical protein